MKNNKISKKDKDTAKTSKDSKVIKMNSEFNYKNLICFKKLIITFIILILIFMLLIFRIAYLQFIDGNHLKELAYQQQVINQIISPKRGNIYDSTGQVALAIGVQVDTITINPSKITDDDPEKAQALKEKVAKGLSEIFELDYNETLEKVNSTQKVETIIKKVEQEKVDQLKTWMNDNDIKVGINIDEDNKRYYPYNSVASSVIGFCNNDNQGSCGIEQTWNSILTGTPGKIVSSKDGSLSRKEIPNAEQTYISAENGSDLTLTIDLKVQNIVEKYLKQAVEYNKCERGGNVIVMNPKNGDILAMANYPNYDLNTPYTPLPNTSYATNFDSLDSSQKSDILYKMWSNKSVAETYEPGSTFKIITASVALEENITTPDVSNEFFCKGYEEFPSTSDKTIEIHCWRDYNPHGPQSLREALGNSCNPAFMQLAKKIQAPTLFKYYNSFGFFDTTESTLYGEQKGIFHELEEMGPVELATYSFGQRFQITPLQMITAISCIANDGTLMKPRIVKQITNTDTGAITEMQPVEVRQVLSKSTTAQVKSMMEYVVTKGTGRNAAVAGYSIGGKTGTSEPPTGKEEEGYVASYVAISPIEDTQVVLLLTLYKPTADDYQGGSVAGPVVSQMFSEILPYLGVPSDTPESTDSSNLITVPDVRNKTVAEAEKILNNLGFTTKISVNGDKNNILVADQTPKPAISLSKNSIIMLYGEGSTIATSVTVPDLKGMTASQATTTLRNSNLNISIDGSGVVINQDTQKDELVPEGTVIHVTLKQALTDAH